MSPGVRGGHQGAPFHGWVADDVTGLLRGSDALFLGSAGWAGSAADRLDLEHTPRQLAGLTWRNPWGRGRLRFLSGRCPTPGQNLFPPGRCSPLKQSAAFKLWAGSLGVQGISVSSTCVLYGAGLATSLAIAGLGATGMGAAASSSAMTGVEALAFPGHHARSFRCARRISSRRPGRNQLRSGSPVASQASSARGSHHRTAHRMLAGSSGLDAQLLPGGSVRSASVSPRRSEEWRRAATTFLNSRWRRAETPSRYPAARSCLKRGFSSAAKHCCRVLGEGACGSSQSTSTAACMGPA